jgi:ECF sigma factor
MSDITRILSAIEQGNPLASEQLLPLVYDELRKLAAAKLAQEKPGQTLQATTLVHEAYVRLVDVHKAQKCNTAAIRIDGERSVRWTAIEGGLLSFEPERNGDGGQ